MRAQDDTDLKLIDLREQLTDKIVTAVQPAAAHGGVSSSKPSFSAKRAVLAATASKRLSDALKPAGSPSSFQIPAGRPGNGSAIADVEAGRGGEDDVVTFKQP